jgi:hypothetical protein
MVDLCTTHYRRCTIPSVQRLDGQVRGRKGGATRCVHRYGRPTQIEVIANTVCDHGGRRGKGALDLSLILSICQLCKSSIEKNIYLF